MADLVLFLSVQVPWFPFIQLPPFHPIFLAFGVEFVQVCCSSPPMRLIVSGDVWKRVRLLQLLSGLTATS
ncbi:hypothetical protein Bca4012_058962 [Brassica carinata]